MNKMPPFGAGTLLGLLFVLSVAAFARIGYLVYCCDQGQLAPALRVQTDPPDEKVTANLIEQHWFGGPAPLSEKEESTAYMAPGPAFVRFALAQVFDPVDTPMRWLQCGLGVVTVGSFFFFARRAFQCTFVAALAGLLIALYPFWIVNVAESSDGVLASFSLGLCLALGARAGQQGGAFTSLLFGLALAGLALVRAAFLPFAVASLLWFLWQCRRFPLGWFAGVLALLGFANGLAPWGLRNYQEFGRPVPIADSTYWHLWMGNNPHANGSILDQDALLATLSEGRKKELFDQTNQARRYNMLAHEVATEVAQHPLDTIRRRIRAAIAYLLGGNWFKDGRLGDMREGSVTVAAPPEWLAENAELVLHGALVAMFVLALLGWRFSYPWRRQGRLGMMAVLLLPLPYILSHAEPLLGPRLPLDGVLLCFAAAGLVLGWLRTPAAPATAKEGGAGQ